MANSYLLPATGNWKLTTVVWPLTPGPWPLTCTNYYVRNYPPFLTNKANFRKSQMNVTNLLTTNYEQLTMNYVQKNKPNTNPIKANLPDDQMNINKVLTKDYENKSNCSLAENKPNTNPKRTQSKPIPYTEQLVRKYSVSGVKSLLKIAEKRL